MKCHYQVIVQYSDFSYNLMLVHIKENLVYNKGHIVVYISLRLSWKMQKWLK